MKQVPRTEAEVGQQVGDLAERRLQALLAWASSSTRHAPDPSHHGLFRPNWSQPETVCTWLI